MRSASCARWILAVCIPATSIALGQPSGFTTQQIGLREGVSSLLFTGMAHLLIFKEAVHNIVKHSAATTASISAQTQNRKFLLRIEDNGKGFLRGCRSDGNGLCNMERRARLHGWTLGVESTPGGGTRISLEIPLG